MRKLVPLLVIAIFIISSCRKEEEPEPVTWDNSFGYFSGTLVNSNDTLHISFNTNNQSTFLSYSCWTEESLYPWDDEARYSSSIVGAYAFEVRKGILYFNGDSWDDIPSDEDFVSYFHSGYDSLVLDDLEYDWDEGIEIRFTDAAGWVYTSADHHNYNNGNYECRIQDYHPFVVNGIQYVKVRMVLNNIHVDCGFNDYNLINCEYEGTFRNN